MRIEGSRLEQAEFRETSKPSFLNLPLNCHFEGNYKNDSYGEFPDFNEFTLYMIFTIFLKKVHPIMPIFVKNLENHMQGEFAKIQDHPYHLNELTLTMSI